MLALTSPWKAPARPGLSLFSLCIGGILGGALPVHRTTRQVAALVSWSWRAPTPCVVASPGRRFRVPGGRGARGAPVCKSRQDAVGSARQGSAMPSHKFHVGESVTLRPAISRNVPGGVYQVTKQLPHDGREFEYRIKSANEEHERVARESELTKA